MLLITQSGNNVDIRTTGTKTEIYVTGTVADITVEGYTWNVNFISGTFAPLTIADVEYYPVLSGGSCNIGTVYYGNVPYSFEPYQTMKDVTTLTATLFHSPGMARTYGTPVGEMSFDHTFIYERGATEYDNYIKRTTTDEFVEEYYVPDDGTIITTFLMYNDCTAYSVEIDSSGDYLIRKVSFSGAGGTASTVYTIASSVGYGGNTYDINEIYYFNRVEYGTIDCLVLVISYHNVDHGEIFRCATYHPVSGASSIQEFDCGFEANCSLHYAIAPSVYQSKIIFTINPNDYWEPPDPIPPTCYCPTYILDTSDDSLTRVNDFLTDVEAGDYLIAIGSSGIDYSTGIYYFIGENIDGYLILSMNLSGSPSLSSGLAPFMHLFQGKTHVYGVERYPAPGVCAVRSIPAFSLLTTINVYVEHAADYFEGACAIDFCYDIIWNIRENTLQGKALSINATSRNISVVWPGGGDVPFTYANNRELFIRVLAGRVLVLVYSTGTTGQYQSDWYLLKECAT